MSDTENEPGVGELEFLTSRYDAILDSYMTTNQIIHTTFYISVVAIAGTMGVVPQFSDLPSRALLYAAAAFLFLAMFGWTKTNLTSRRTMDEAIAKIVDTVEEREYDLGELLVEEFFSTSEEFNRDRWESRKEDFLKVYYLGVAGIAILVLAVDVLVSLTGTEALICIP